LAATEVAQRLNAEWGFHFLGGQAWSMLTQNTVGITARKENIPMTIEANYVPGFDYTRNGQLRLVQDIGTRAALGLSVENPAELVYASTGAVGNGGNIGGFAVNFQNAGSSFLGSGGCQQLYDRYRARHHRQGSVRSRLANALARRLDHDAPGVSAWILEGLDEMLTLNAWVCRPSCGARSAAPTRSKA
jgi:hypothetical protein